LSLRYAGPNPGSRLKPILMMAIAASMVAAGSSHARQTMQTARQLLEA
jgi:hypothetical protein